MRVVQKVETMEMMMAGEMADYLVAQLVVLKVLMKAGL